MTISIYAALIAVLIIFLSARTIILRRKNLIALGDAKHPALRRAIRAHANCVEYAPIALFLMFLSEMQGTPIWIIHLLGIGLLTGRIIHAYGISQEPENTLFRVIGMVLTLNCIGFSALAALLSYLLGL